MWKDFDVHIRSLRPFSHLRLHSGSKSRNFDQNSELNSNYPYSVGSPVLMEHSLVFRKDPKATFKMCNTPSEDSLLLLTETPVEMEDGTADPPQRTFNTMVCLKIYLSSKLQKLQSRHFRTSRTQWGNVCETSFISLYHRDM